MGRSSLLIRSIWAACLLIAAANHALILIRHGPLWTYGGVAWPSAAYWSSLTILDPLVAVLLFVRPRLGVLSAIVLIVSNVIHNLAITAYYAPAGDFLSRAASSPMILIQIVFMLFVLLTAPIAIRQTPQA